MHRIKRTLPLLIVSCCCQLVQQRVDTLNRQVLLQLRPPLLPPVRRR